MIIGVDLGGTNIRVGLVDQGKVIGERHQLLTDKASLTKTISQLIAAIALLDGPEITGIGIGVPSVVDTVNGIVYNVVNIPSWERVELKAILEDAFRKPVSVNNDVNCFILGEHLYGLAKDCSDVVGLALGTGLGAGIIINKALYQGHNCGAGELGLLPYLDQNFEFYTSSNFFISKYATTAVKAHQEAISNNREAIRQWEEFGIHLGNILKVVVYTYDPEMIILGGSIAKAYNFFNESMMAEFKNCFYKESVKNIRICCSDNENTSILGASALIR